MSDDCSDDDMELRRIRMAKMQQLMQMKQQALAKSQQKIPTLADKIDQLMKVLLQPAALEYLNQIKARNIQVYNSIRSALFPPDITSEIDMLMSYLQQGMIRAGIIPITEIQLLERKFLGIESTITVKKQGEEAVTLSKFLKEEE
jgi:DNA-binding TFAR19-related protein (PDSD5 family)